MKEHIHKLQHVIAPVPTERLQYCVGCKSPLYKWALLDQNQAINENDSLSILSHKCLGKQKSSESSILKNKTRFAENQVVG